MPVIYATETKERGFIPCSWVYRRQIIRSMELQRWDTVEELFRQGHKHVWKWSQPANVYENVYDPRYIMNRVEYHRLATLPGDQITIQDLNKQCNPVTGNTDRRRYFGPQTGLLYTAYRKLLELQKASYHKATSDGFPVSNYLDLAVYSPSPFPQRFHPETKHWEPDQIVPCAVDADCKDPQLTCENKFCVIRKEHRQCPPFQYPFNIGIRTIHDLSQHRTKKVQRFSEYRRRVYDTCDPGDNYTHGRWIPKELETYLGIDFNVLELPVAEWNHRVQVSNYQVHRDPATDAPFFVAIVDGTPHRFYKLNSAFSPILDLQNYLQVVQEGQAGPADDDLNDEAPDDEDLDEDLDEYPDEEQWGYGADADAEEKEQDDEDADEELIDRREFGIGQRDMDDLGDAGSGDDIDDNIPNESESEQEQKEDQQRKRERKRKIRVQPGREAKSESIYGIRLGTRHSKRIRRSRPLKKPERPNVHPYSNP